MHLQLELSYRTYSELLVWKHGTSWLVELQRKIEFHMEIETCCSADGTRKIHPSQVYASVTLRNRRTRGFLSVHRIQRTVIICTNLTIYLHLYVDAMIGREQR
jgi:hypothetical protein